MTNEANSPEAIERASAVIVEAIAKLTPDVPVQVVNGYTSDLPTELPSVWARITRAIELEDGDIAFSAELATFNKAGESLNIVPSFEYETWGKLEGETFGEISKDVRASDRWRDVERNELPFRSADLPGGSAVHVVGFDAIAKAPGQKRKQGPPLTPYGYMLQRQDGSIYYMTGDELRYQFNTTGTLPPEFAHLASRGH